MDDLTLRIATPDEDWAAIHSLVDAAFAFMTGRVDPPSSIGRWTPQRFAAAAATGPAFLATLGGKVVGCAFGLARGDALYLSKIAVAPEMRGRGVARRLIGFAAWEADRRDLAALELESRIELTAAHRAFTSLGFAEFSRSAHPGFDRATSILFRRDVVSPEPPFPPGGLSDVESVIRSSPALTETLRRARDMALPDWWVVSGALYNQVWNALTGRPDMYGVKDIDLFYFDADDGWEAEDRVIRRGAEQFEGAPMVEIRNQARVPLWYRDHFGHDYPPITSSREAIDHFACRTHCIGARLEDDDRLTIYAPYGLDDIFAFRLTPNPILPNRETHERKAARQTALWPELTVIPWPDGDET